MPANVWEMNYSMRHFRAWRQEDMPAGVCLHLSDAPGATLNKALPSGSINPSLL